MLVRYDSVSRTMILASLLAVAAAMIAAAPVRAYRTIPEAPLPELFDEDVSCYDAAAICQQFIPYFMYVDEPDSLLATIDWWEFNCGSAEPIRRIRILASIWDAAFDESLYDARLLDDLIWRWDAGRGRAQEAGEMPRTGHGSVSTIVDVAGDAIYFDAFTEDIADQLLPHALAGSPEEFFCLFYSGRTDQAYELLRGDALAGTELYRRYHRELSRLDVPDYHDFAGVSGGYWMPSGKLQRVGDHWTTGVFAGRRWPRGMLRGELSLRLGRADYPYAVRVDDWTEWSDRYGGVSLAVEGGPSVARVGPVTLDLLAGGSIEALNPFKEDDDLVLTWLHGWFGAGLHWEPTSDGMWFVDLDFRHEWVGDPQEQGTDLGGRAWNIRMAFGFALVSAAERRLTGLGG